MKHSGTMGLRYPTCYTSNTTDHNNKSQQSQPSLHTLHHFTPIQILNKQQTRQMCCLSDSSLQQITSGYYSHTQTKQVSSLKEFHPQYTGRHSHKVCSDCTRFKQCRPTFDKTRSHLNFSPGFSAVAAAWSVLPPQPLGCLLLPHLCPAVPASLPCLAASG